MIKLVINLVAYYLVITELFCEDTYLISNRDYKFINKLK